MIPFIPKIAADVMKIISFVDLHLTPLVHTTQRQIEGEKPDQPVPSTGPTQSQQRPQGQSVLMLQSLSWARRHAQGQVYCWRWGLIAIWIEPMAGSISFICCLSSVLDAGGDALDDSQSQMIAMLLILRLHQPATQVLVVLHSSTPPVSAPTYQRKVWDVLTHVKRITYIPLVMQAGIGRDGHAELVVIGFDRDTDTVTQRLSSIRPFWSLFSLTTISLLCYSNRRLVPISQRMPGTWAMALCEESAMSTIIAFPTRSATASPHIAPIDAAESLWQVDCRRSVLPMVICFQPITSSLTRTVTVHQNHAGQQTHRVDCHVPTQRVMADHFYQFM